MKTQNEVSHKYTKRETKRQNKIPHEKTKQERKQKIWWDNKNDKMRQEDKMTTLRDKMRWDKDTKWGEWKDETNKTKVFEKHFNSPWVSSYLGS